MTEAPSKIDTKHGAPASGKPKLIYIISPSYSGSTLLTFLLARHPAIATIGELKATAHGDLEIYHCSCGSRFLDCPFWAAIQVSARQRGLNFSLEDFQTHFAESNPLVDRILGAQVRGGLFETLRSLCIQAVPQIRQAHRRILEQNFVLADLIRQKLGGSYFLDGSKDPNRLLYFLRSDKWDIHVIKMIRDGRAQCNSQRNKKYFHGSFGDAACEWKKTIHQIERVCAGVSHNRLHDLTYETLCAGPGEALDKVWDFLGISPIATEEHEINLKGEEQHILGNEMRTSSNITIRLDEGWKSKIGARELDDFERIAGSLNRRFYPEPAAASPSGSV